MKTRLISSLAIAGSFVCCLFAFLPTRDLQNDRALRDTDTTVIILNAIPGLQFDLARFTVKPRAHVRLVLRNKDDMSHNIVFTKPGKRESVVKAAAKLDEKGPSMEYTPDSDEVLWKMPVLAPGEERTLKFTAPDTEAIYPYVCTFPGHGFYMYGAMYVRADGKMPEMEKDENIPSTRRLGKTLEHASQHEQQLFHPYELTPPYLYRAYMPDANPAAIAVRLPRDLAFCWDAEACELCYAWEGEFLDNTAFWKGKPNAEAKILGSVFFRNRVKQPLRTSESISPVNFKGYRLIERYPEFYYTLGGVDVYETILPTPAGDGLIRTFRIPDSPNDVWFTVDAKDGMQYECSVGRWNNNTLQIPKAATSRFSIVMTKKEGIWK